MSNTVYIATSIDGYIADKEGGLDWLHSIPNPDNHDFGWTDFIGKIDAIIMGRNTFDVVCGFEVEWPYTKPVFVLSSTMTSVADEYKGKAEVISGPLPLVIKTLNERGFFNFYVDGGKTIQSFLVADLIDYMIITQLPILLGGGISLFGTLAKPLTFEHMNTQVHLDAMVQSHYRRV